MLAWLRERTRPKKVRAALVEADVVDLMARFGARAYYVALDRDRDERSGKTVDADRPPRHWSAVKASIAAFTGKRIGLDTATGFLEAERRDGDRASPQVTRAVEHVFEHLGRLNSNGSLGCPDGEDRPPKAGASSTLR